MANTVKLTTGAFNAASFAAAASAPDFEAARPKVSSGGIPYLRLLREDGSWEFGQESIIVPDDALWGAFPQSFAHGYVAWKGKKIIGKYLSIVGQPPINIDDLPDVTTKRGWEPAVAVAMVCVECESDPSIVGTVVIYETSSNGGMQAWSQLFDKTIAQAKAGHEEFSPVIRLSSSSYNHEEWDIVFKPMFKLDSWDTVEGLVTDAVGGMPSIDLVREVKKGEDDDDDDDDVKPASRRRTTDKAEKAKDVTPKARKRETVEPKAPEAEPEVEKVDEAIPDAEVVSEAPAPRRRRRAAAEADAD